MVATFVWEKRPILARKQRAKGNMTIIFEYNAAVKTFNIGKLSICSNR